MFWEPISGPAETTGVVAALMDVASSLNKLASSELFAADPAVVAAASIALHKCLTLRHQQGWV
jgi:hypothetical protein